jgi:uncharacterized protein YdgA (DUF945 family)
MNKAVVGAVALVAVAGGGVVGFAAWSGGKVAGELQAQTAALAAPFPGIKVVENSVSKGLFSSVHTVTLDIGCTPAAEAPALQPAVDGAPAGKPLQITWRDHVRHGPLPGGKGLGLATIDTEIVLPPEVAAQLARLFGDKPVVQVHTALGFGGTYVSELTSPPFKYAEAGKGDIHWQGATATVRGSLTGGLGAGGSYSFEAPGLSVNFASEQANGTLRVGRIALQGEVSPQPDASLLLSPGRGTGGIDSITFALAPAGGKVVDVRFEKLVFDSEAKVDGQGLWSAVSKMGMTGRVDDFAIEQIDMQVSLNRLHGATYQQLINRAMQSSFGCHKPGDEAAMREAAALAADMQKGFTTLLMHNPEYGLDRLAVRLGGKTAELSYRLGTKGVTEADAALPLPALLGTKGYGAATFKVEDGWIEQVVTKVVATKAAAEGVPADETVAQTMAMINATLDDLVAKGYVAREGKAVVSKAAFEGGLLKVNDQPLQVPMGMIGK